jgi:hypothetical protein
MPSARHEFLHQFCADSPKLLARILNLTGFKEELDETAEPEELSGDATNLTPASRHADTTVRVVTPRHGAPLVLVVEAQLGKDTDKRFTWPAYVANLRDRHRKEVVLVVICPDHLAEWAAAPSTPAMKAGGPPRPPARSS